MRNPIILGVALSVAAAPLLALPSAAQADTSARTKHVVTNYGMTAAGYGSRIVGGSVPLNSGSTAFQNVACTSTTGKSNVNFLENLDVPGLGSISNLKTTARTVKKGHRIMSVGTHRIGSIVFDESALGTLTLNAVRTQTRAYHDRKGFHVKRSSDIGSIVFAPAGQAPQTLPLPSPGQPIPIPGVATISVGAKHTKITKHRAAGKTFAVKVHVDASDSLVKLATTRASITDGVLSGRFSGYSSPVSADLVGGLLQVGKVVLRKMPCVGTGGEVLTKNAAGVDISGNLTIGAATAREKGQQNRRRAKGFEESSVAGINVGGGQLKIDLIKARANVSRTKAKGSLKRSIKGTSIGTITANGDPMSPGDLDNYEIPGVARFDTFVKSKIASGIKITALRITLLDGTAADSVVNLGTAKLRIASKKG